MAPAWLVLRKTVDIARAEVQESKDEGRFEQHERLFDAITVTLGEPPLSTTDLFQRQKDWERSTDLQAKRLRERLGDKERASWRNKVIDVRNWFDFSAREIERATGETRSCYDGSSGQSGGEKAKLAFTILVAAIA